MGIKVSDRKKEKKEVIIDCPCQNCKNKEIDVHRFPCSDCWNNGLSTGCFEYFSKENEL